MQYIRGNKDKLDPTEEKFEDVRFIHQSSTQDWLTLLKVRYLVKEVEDGQRSPTLKISNIVIKG